MRNTKIEITWFGFGAIYIKTSSGKKILIDPWVQNNPLFPTSLSKTSLDCDFMLLTHGHRDHAEDAVKLAQETGATVIAGWELAQLLMQRGVKHVLPINKGGSRFLEDFKVTAVHADHSGAFVENGNIIYGGEPMGYVLRFDEELILYHAGDTNVFGDMAIIAELYEPTVAILPIGDVLTMGPREAAKAVQLLNVKEVIPMHFGYDFLTGTPEMLTYFLNDEQIKVHNIQSGEKIIYR
ncbi:MAG TPA: metal-dependent hydrolase [Neobacillus sp.]|jgi:L-ascorbate metabolism protein UlaG (beta-lactamase superfamily)